MSDELSELLLESSGRHHHLCPRQVLGVRIGLAGMSAMHWRGNVVHDLALVIIEIDGCFADGIEVATGATIGHRTLRINDLGKIAATFTDLSSGKSLRIWPQLHVRDKACGFAPKESHRYLAQIQGYQRMPDEELLHIAQVSLDPQAAAIMGSPAARTVCSRCGEEIFNERELLIDGEVACRHCAGKGYYVVDLSTERLRTVRSGAVP